MPITEYRLTGGQWVSLADGSVIGGTPGGTGQGIFGIHVIGGESAIEALEHTVGATFAANRMYDTNIPSTWAGSGNVIDNGKRASVWSGTPNMSQMAAGSLDTAVGNFIESIPDGHTTYVTVYHEFDLKIKDGTYTLAQWRPAFKAFCDAVHEVGRDDVKTYLCSTRQWWQAGTPPSPDTYWPGDDLNGYVDVLAPDGYNQNWPVTDPSPGAKWKTPAQLFGPAIQLAASKGVPWGICEVGCDEDNSDPQHKPQWIGQLADLMDDPNCKFVCYFNSGSGAQGSDSRLMTSSQYSTAAFKAAMLARPLGTVTV